MTTKEDTAALEANPKAADRRAFLRGAGFTGLGLAGAAVAAGRLGILDNNSIAPSLGLHSQKVSAAGISDVDILNFALNLEYLEAEFYTVAFTGKNLEESGFKMEGVGASGKTTGGRKVNFNSGDPLYMDLTAVAQELLNDEQAHVRLLRTTLGKDAIAKPAIDLDALGIGFDSFDQFLTLARAFEDVGVSAYGGAAPLIASTQILATAARIALTEALHSGNIRSLISFFNIDVPRLDSQDVPPPPTGRRYFTVNSQALAIVRTPAEVLSIAYGSSKAGTSSGGFFPNGMNGVITKVEP